MSSLHDLLLDSELDMNLTQEMDKLFGAKKRRSRHSRKSGSKRRRRSRRSGSHTSVVGAKKCSGSKRSRSRSHSRRSRSGAKRSRSRSHSRRSRSGAKRRRSRRSGNPMAVMGAAKRRRSRRAVSKKN